MNGYIRKILPFSAVDGEGNRTVIFFQECNFNCIYCHNPETIPFSPKTEYLSVNEIYTRIKPYLPFISGVTISGGECTVQYNFLENLLQYLKANNVKTFIDTNAFLEPEKMLKLSNFFDMAMIDIKSINNTEHQKLTGQENHFVITNTINLLKINKVYEIRTVIFPGLNNEETVNEASLLIASINKNVRYKLIAFRKKGVRKTMEFTEPDSKEIIYYKEIARKNGLLNIITV